MCVCNGLDQQNVAEVILRDFQVYDIIRQYDSTLLSFSLSFSLLTFRTEPPCCVEAQATW